jgi:hypothetical protein
MVLDAANQQRRLDSIADYYEIFGKAFLDKLSRSKYNKNFDQLTGYAASNFKRRITKFQDFILDNKRLPTEFEARSLGHELSRGPRELKVQMSLLEDLKTGPVKVTAESLAKKYNVSVEKLKEDANNLQRNIWRKRMGNNPNAVKQYPLKWMVDEGNDLDNVLNNLYKAKVIKYERNKIRDLFYDAFGRKTLEGSNIKNPTYSPKKWAAMRANWNDYNKIRNVINKKYPNIVFELDHPLSKATLKTYFDATPSQLTRVNPMAAGLNRGFKKVLDEKYGKAIKNKNTEQLKSLNKIAKDLNINFGKVSKDFTKFDYGIKPFEKIDIRKSMADALTQQQKLSTELPKYTKANPELFAKAGIDLKTIDATVPELGMKIKDLKRLVTNLTNKEKIAYCSLLSRGGLPGDCAAAIDNNPVKAAQVFDEAPVTSKGMEKVKNAASSFLNFAKKGGKFGALVAVGAAGAGAVKTFMNDDPTTYLSNEDQQKNMLIDMVTGQLDDTPVEEAPIGEAYLPALGAATVAGTAVTAPSTIDAVRGGALGAKKSGITKTALKTLGKGFAASQTPLGILATEPLYLAEQIQEGDSLGEIATNPLNYFAPAFAADADRLVSRGLKSPGIAKAMRLGISPAALRIGSRFFGLPGLALSLGISGYEMYDDYKKKRGMFSEE